MADQWSIKDLVAFAKRFVITLREVEETDKDQKRKRDNFAAEIDACIEAWENLSKVLQDQSLEQGKDFVERLAQIIDDNVAIFSCLQQDLANVLVKERKARQKSRYRPWNHASAHPIVLLFGNQLTLLRQKQIKSAHATLKLMFEVVL